MQFKRVAATAIGALLAGATIAMPVLGATDLSNFPAPFVDGGKANFVIVVGSGGEAAGLASDIAGAIDIAARMGGESYTASAGTGASISGGDSKDVPLNLVLSNSAAFDRTVWKNNKIPGLFKGKIDFKSKSINAHEEIVLDDKGNDGTADSIIRVAISGITGTGNMYEEAGDKPGLVQTDKGTIQYLYVVEKDATNFKHDAVSTTDSLKISMLGKTLKITAITTNQITMELGTELALKVGDSQTVDGKTVEVTSIGQSSVAVKIGSETKFIGSSTTADTTETISGMKVTVPKNGILYTQEAESRQVQLRVGSETSATVNNGDPLKQFGEPDDATAAKWTWVVTNVTNNDISVGAKFNWQLDSKTEDYGAIAFAGQSLDFPSNFGGVLFDSLVESNFRQYSVSQESSLDASNAMAGLTSMPVYVFTASGVTNEGFTVLKAGSNIDTHIVYVNNTGGIFYKDSNGKVQFASQAGTGKEAWNFTVSYGDISGTNGIVVYPTNGPGGSANPGDTGAMVNASAPVDRFYLKMPEHYTGVGTKNLTLATGSSIASSTVRFGATAGEKEANEVIYGGTAFGTRKYDVLTDLGAVILNPESNGNSNKAIIKVPASKQRAKIVIKGPTTTVAGGSGAAMKIANPIKTAVAKVDTEVSDASALKEHLVLVGGPCVNRLTAQALKLDFPACGDASGMKAGDGVVKFVADAFKTGQNALLVYGFEKENTRAAANAVQNFDAKGFKGTEYMAK